MKIQFLKSNTNLLLTLQIATIGYLALTLLKGIWIGDFWEHAAVVKQLSSGNFHLHPLYNVNLPHAFYTPYHFFWGYFAKLSGINILTTLSIAGFLNALLLIYIFPKFVYSIFKKTEISILSLVFVLILWVKPFNFSGFISLNVLPFVLPYPSTFSIALTLVLFTYLTNAKHFKTPHYLSIITISTIVTLTHPLTGIICYCAIVSIFINKFGLSLKPPTLLLLFSLTTSLLLIHFWPFYPFYNLALNSSKAFHSANVLMYAQIPLMCFPAILALPIIVFYNFKAHNKSLIYLLYLLLVIYIYGYLTGNWSFGRVLSFIIIIGHIYLAKFSLDTYKKLKTKSLVKLVSIIILLLFFSRNFYTEFITTKGQWQVTYAKYKGLASYINKNDVILSDRKTSWQLPAFGCKIISALHPQAFVKNSQQRSNDNKKFMNDSSITNSERQQIIDRYSINKILIPQNFNLNPSLKNWLSKTTKPIFEDDKFTLYNIN